MNNGKQKAAFSIMLLVIGVPAMAVFWLVLYLIMGAGTATLCTLAGIGIAGLVIWLIASS